jgi:hypothetical protein
MRRIVIVLALVALAASFAAFAAAPAADPAPDAVEVPSAGAEAAPPAEDGAGEELPFLDLETPEPAPTCKTGWCSNDEQCVDWTGDPWSVCVKQQGASCGQCVAV